MGDIALEENNIVINSLNNWKAPGTDKIPDELLKCVSETLH